MHFTKGELFLNALYSDLINEHLLKIISCVYRQSAAKINKAIPYITPTEIIILFCTIGYDYR